MKLTKRTMIIGAAVVLGGAVLYFVTRPSTPYVPAGLLNCCKTGGAASPTAVNLSGSQQAPSTCNGQGAPGSGSSLANPTV